MYAEKEQLRRHMIVMRKSQANKDEISRVILDRVIDLPAYIEASVVMWYIDVRDEVRTTSSLESALSTDKTIVVPFCVDNQLGLFRLESMSELSPGTYGILEPNRELRKLEHKTISLDSLDVILVPGVAFDTHGGRLGYGKGYFDRMLSDANKSTIKIGIAYDCQMIDQVPTAPHDVTMDVIVTQSLVVSML